MKSFKIAMLGASNSGKTVFMTAMYNLLNKGRKGFSLTASNPKSREFDKDTHNYLIDNWKKITQDKTWVMPNLGIDQYSFSFEKGDNTLVYFDFIDYRGSSLAGSENSDDQEVYRVLEKHLMDSQIVMCCIPGDYWNEVNENGFSTINAELENIRFFLRALKKRKNDLKRGLPPVIILTTKFDNCKSLDKSTLKELIKEEFNTLFYDDSNWLISTMGVTLGENLTDFNEDLTKAKISPKGMIQPFVFAIYFIFSQIQKIHEKEKSSHEKSAIELGGGWFGFFDWLNSRSIDSHNSQVRKHQEDINLLRENASLIKSTFQLEDATIYHRGNELDFTQFENLLTRSDMNSIW